MTAVFDAPLTGRLLVASPDLRTTPRNQHGEGRTFAHFAFDGDFASQQFAEFADDGESQACSGMFASQVVVADDHPLMREALTNFLQKQDDFEVVGAAADGEQAAEEACPSVNRMPSRARRSMLGVGIFPRSGL